MQELVNTTIKNMTPEQRFAYVCYLTLMQNGDGLIDKSPDYIHEKSYMLEVGTSAFGALDIHNMRKVKEWCNVWGVEMPKECQDELNAQEAAYLELAGKGIIF